jgi:uncharacterized membrane protein
MSDETTEEVLRLAREQISAKRRTLDPIRLRREHPWVPIFLGAIAILLLALLLTPGTPLEYKLYAVVHGVCAQQHNIVVGRLQFPLCARNTGIYLSFLLTFGYMYVIGRGRSGRIPPWSISIALLAFVAIMAVDGFNSLFLDIGSPYLYEPQNWLRTLTGMGFGIALAVMLHLVLNQTLRNNVDDQQPALRNWVELGGIMLVDLLALAAIYGNLELTYWPLAFLAYFGITGVLYLVMLLLVSLILGYEGRVSRVSQLARPATIAILPTLIILGAFSALRFWLEGLGLII